MDAGLVKILMEASIEFGYNAQKNGLTLEQAVKRYNVILEEWLAKSKHYLSQQS